MASFWVGGCLFASCVVLGVLLLALFLLWPLCLACSVLCLALNKVCFFKKKKRAVI